jgi:PAS domain S-box-containing protein
MMNGHTGKLQGKQRLVKILLLVLSLLALFNSTLFALQETKPKHVLVLASHRPTSPIAYQWSWGILSVLEPGPPHGIKVDIEYLDMGRFNDDHYVRLLLDVYRYKYSKLKPDLIITTFNAALDMMLRYGAELFPGVPIVFSDVERSFLESRSMGPNTTGVLAYSTYKETLNLALNLHPDTRRVTVVSGAGISGGVRLKTAREVFKGYEDRVDFTYLVGLPMKGFLEKVTNLPGQTLVIYLPVLVDGAGKKFDAIEPLTLISQASSAPVYSCWEICLGHGVVGGYLNSHEMMGKAVAELGLRILKGETPAAIDPVQEPKFQYMFDWRQLKRWSIDENRLPPGSIVRFKEFTVWDQYRGPIIGVIALIVFQALIISYLLHQRQIRRRSEEKVMQTEQKYRTVADYTYDWEYWQNPDGSLQYVSPSCDRISGYSVQDFMDNPSLFQDIIVPEDRKVWDEHGCSVRNGMKSEGIQFRIQRPDGEIRWIEHVCQTIYDQEGNNEGVRASNRDITERESYKSETTRLQSELAHMDRVVTIGALTSALAHEINQPLAAMRSYAQAALRFLNSDHPDYVNVRKALHGIVDDNKRAAAVINQLRNLVKKETATGEKLDINSAINDVIGLIHSEIVLRNVSIRLDLHPIVPVVYGDSIQIQQVLINLLTNALDALDGQPSEARTITISTRTENSNDIIISISDSGEGIPPDKIQAIFAPFHTTKPKGLGLGLSICKTIIEAHGGKIWADNNPEGGVIFSLILPTGSQSK